MWSREGAAGLLTGFTPTVAGYLAQGGAKFAGYEFWKAQLVAMSGGREAAAKHRTAIYLASAAVAEFFADVLLTPLEAVRIRMVSDRTYASGLVPGVVRMAKEGGLYAGFIPICCKMVPYTCGQFVVNEWAHEAVLMTAFLVSGQFLIFGGIKEALHVETAEIRKLD
ncbi:hypothetical protein RQP46_006934 [Phenoliferia psychrophenolica]